MTVDRTLVTAVALPVTERALDSWWRAEREEGRSEALLSPEEWEDLEGAPWEKSEHLLEAAGLSETLTLVTVGSEFTEGGERLFLALSSHCWEQDSRDAAPPTLWTLEELCAARSKLEEVVAGLALRPKSPVSLVTGVHTW